MKKRPFAANPRDLPRVLQRGQGLSELNRINAENAGEPAVTVLDVCVFCSLWRHAAGVRCYWMPSTSLAFELGGAVELRQTDLDASSPFALEGPLGLAVTLEHTRELRTRLELELRPALGLGGRDDLTGLRGDVALAETYESGPWELRFSLGFRRQGLGSQSIPLAAGRFPRCGFM